jgi:hypothetical protein
MGPDSLADLPGHDHRSLGLRARDWLPIARIPCLDGIATQHRHIRRPDAQTDMFGDTKQELWEIVGLRERNSKKGEEGTTRSASGGTLI